jgi:hypothetical protein
MEQYVALDVSLKEISVCIVDSNGDVSSKAKPQLNRRPWLR